MTVKTMDDLLIEGLKDIYYAEKKILKALPKMANKASSDQLRNAFTNHVKETEDHVARLEKIFKLLGRKASGKRCDAIEGIVAEGEELMKEVKDREVLDAGLLAGAQAVEHYEIARYGTLRAWAAQLGLDDAVPLIERTLDEEKATDGRLSEIANDQVNEFAAR